LADASTKRWKRANPKTRGVRSISSQAPVRIKRLTLDLPEPLHRAIKKNAAEEGVTMAQKLRRLLSEHYGVSD
jgi:predicted DNA binding CopG/RHH family protein